MTFEQKLKYLSDRRMLVVFHQDGDYRCSICIEHRKPVVGVGVSIAEAFGIAFDKAVFKTEVLRCIS